MYVLIEAKKGRYDRPIDIIKRETSETIESLQKILFQSLIGCDEDEETEIKDAIENQKTYVELYNDKIVNLYYGEHGFIGYATNCPSINEFIGESFEIITI